MAETTRRAPRRAGKRGVRFWLPALLGVLAIPFAIGYVVAAFLIFPDPAVPTNGIPVPALRGMTTLDAERALARAGLGRLVTTELPHPDLPAGQIMAQSPLAGQQLRNGMDVRVAVSSGPPRVAVPDVLGQSGEQAQAALRRAGFDVTLLQGESQVAAGRVYDVQPPAGSTQAIPGVVTVWVSLGPPAVDSTQLQLPPDTIPPPVR